MRARRLAQAAGAALRPVAMRDTDCDLTSVVVVRALPPGGQLTVTGRHPALAIHLAAWCREQGHRFGGGDPPVITKGRAGRCRIHAYRGVAGAAPAVMTNAAAGGTFGGCRGGAGPPYHLPVKLAEMLGRWVAAGLIDQEQADRIAAAEAARRPAPPATRRTPLAVEALGYTGGVLAIAAGFLAVQDLWPDIPAAAQLGFAGAAAVALGLGGAVLRAHRDPALSRLCGVLWLLSAASLAGFAGILTAEILHFAGEPAAFTAAAAAACYAAALWLLRPGVLQHLALFASVGVTVGTGVSWAGPGQGAWGPGLGIWVLSALWWLAVSRGRLGPRPAGDIAAALGLLAGAQLTMGLAAGHVLAIATVAGLLIAGVAVRRVWLVAFGAVGVLLVVPQTAVRYLPASAGAPLAVFVVGLALVAAALWLAKHRAPHSR